MRAKLTLVRAYEKLNDRAPNLASSIAKENDPPDSWIADDVGKVEVVEMTLVVLVGFGGNFGLARPNIGSFCNDNYAKKKTSLLEKSISYICT